MEYISVRVYAALNYASEQGDSERGGGGGLKPVKFNFLA